MLEVKWTGDTFQLIPEFWGISHSNILGQAPNIWIMLIYLMNRKKVRIARVSWTRDREVADVVRSQQGIDTEVYCMYIYHILSVKGKFWMILIKGTIQFDLYFEKNTSGCSVANGLEDHKSRSREIRRFLQ